VFIAGHVALLAVYVVLWLQGGSGAAAIGVCILVLGMYYAMTDGVLAAAVSTTVGPEMRGSGLATAGIIVSLFRALAALAFGWLWTAFGVATALGCFAAGLSCALLSSSWLFSRLEGELA
jgi:hypothetical protein